MNVLSSEEEDIKEERFPVSEYADPLTKGVSMFISMKSNDEAIIFLDTEVTVILIKIFLQIFKSICRV